MLCSLVFLCCLDFGIWSLDHRVNFFSFLFTFFLTFLRSLFFLFFPLLLLSFEPLILLPHLVTCYLVLSPLRLGASSCCLELLPRHLVMPYVTSSCCLVVVPHVALSLDLLPQPTASSLCRMMP